MHLEITDTRATDDDALNVREMEFHDQPVSVGSHSANAVQLPDTDIAPYHAMILPTLDDQWIYQPTVAETTTMINGHRTIGQVQLEHGDVLKITRFEIKFTLDEEVELKLPEVGNLNELAKIRQYPVPPRTEICRGDDDITLTSTRQQLLARFGADLRRCTAHGDLLDCTLGMLLEELGARTVWMGVRRGPTGPLEAVDGRSDKGKYSGEPAILETFIYRCLTRHQFIRIPRTGAKETQSVLAVPILIGAGAVGMILADTRRRRRVFDESDLHFLTIISRFVASQLETIQHGQATQQATLATSELSLLQEVQAQLDPRNVPQWPQLQIAAFAKPGLEASGDIYDVMRLPNGLASVFVGHVRADTTRTALAMAEVRAAFRVAGLHADPPHIQLRAMNWLLHDDKYPCTLDAAIFVTNPTSGAAEYCTAGQIGVTIIDERGYARSLTLDDAPPIGVGKTGDFNPHKDRLQERETIAFHTPGCYTVTNQDGDRLGKERFNEALADGFGQPANAALDGLLADLAAFLKNGRSPDDITVLLMHRDSAGV